MSAAIAPIAGAASSLIGGLLGSHAVGNASNQILGGLNNAQNAVTTGINSANGIIDTQNATAQGTLSPYVQAGAQGIQSLAAGLAPGGQFTQQMDPSQILAQNPGYQFDLQQGEQAIQNNASSQGTGISGGELKGLTSYAQGNALNAYQTAFQNYNTTQNQNFSRLQDLAGTGQASASQSANLNAAQGNTQAGIYTQGQNNLANIYEQEGNTRAAATLGRTADLVGGLQGAISGAGSALSGVNFGSIFGGGGQTQMSNDEYNDYVNGGSGSSSLGGLVSDV